MKYRKLHGVSSMSVMAGIILLVSNLVHAPVFGQAQRDTAILVHWQNVFSTTCICEASDKYHVLIEIAPFSGANSREDSVRNHNMRVSLFYNHRLPDHWLDTMLREIQTCEQNTCNPDSSEKYMPDGFTGGTLTMAWLMVPGTAVFNASQLCLIDHTVLFILLREESLTLQIESHALPGETEFSAKRGETLREYLVSKGIAPERILLIDSGVQDPRYPTHPDHPRNCRIVIRLMGF